MATTYGYSYIYYPTADEEQNMPIILQALADDETAYLAIRHIGEAGDKDHVHLYVIGDKWVKRKSELTTKLVNALGKHLAAKIVDPIKNLAEMTLYAVHQPDYLRIKHMMREHHYKYTDMYTTDDDLKGRLIAAAEQWLAEHCSMTRDIKDRYAAGESKTEIALSLTGNSIQGYCNARALVYDLTDNEKSVECLEDRIRKLEAALQIAKNKMNNMAEHADENRAKANILTAMEQNPMTQRETEKAEQTAILTARMTEDEKAQLRYEKAQAEKKQKYEEAKRLLHEKLYEKH